jgi:hypothetical protein
MCFDKGRRDRDTMGMPRLFLEGFVEVVFANETAGCGLRASRYLDKGSRRVAGAKTGALVSQMRAFEWQKKVCDQGAM